MQSKVASSAAAVRYMTTPSRMVIVGAARSCPSRFNRSGSALSGSCSKSHGTKTTRPFAGSAPMISRFLACVAGWSTSKTVASESAARRHARQSKLLGFFRMRVGDTFSTDKLRKGLEDMRKYYGLLGYWDFVPEPSMEVIPDTDQIDLTITADEGKQFFVRRIEFAGNTTTRDKVIRREFQLDEGDIFNTQMLDVSILRLNQLGYFEMLKKDDAADIRRNPGSDTVDITLKVKERGKNSIGLNGGVSGIAGSFVGFNYSTNNFLGLGETLSLSSQLGTRSRDASFGFTEPYFLDRPLQLGFVIYVRRFDFNQGREASILQGQNLIGLYNSLGTQNLLNYIQNSYGFNVSRSEERRV